MTKLQAFEVHRAYTVAAASELLDLFGDEAVVYAGGTELLLLMKLGFAEFTHLVDVKSIPELGQLAVVDGTLVVGASVTHRAIERSPIVRLGWPAFAEMERHVANIRVRNVGTLGGNLAFADPHSDPATSLVALGARVRLGRGEERRTLPIGEFILGPYATALRPGELLVAIEIPAIPDGAALAHLKFAFHERPAATVSCFLRVDRGAIVEIRLAVGSVGTTAGRLLEAEGIIVGSESRAIEDQVIEAAGRAAGAAADPVTDANGSIEYKRDLVRVLVGRCIREAARRASSADAR